MSLVRVIPLGGAGEIGKNCTVVEQGDDLVVVDCGLSFPHEEHYGVDIVVPDFTYLHENRHRIRGVFITHAHEDHVGALSFLLPELNVPLVCTPLTAALVRNKLEERMNILDADIQIVNPGDTVPAGEMSVEFVRVTHSIPETCALAVRTAHGIVLFTADFKFDFTPVDGKQTDLNRLVELGREGVVLLLSDSTNVDRPGWGPSESAVTEGMRKVFREAPGRVLITMFSSNIHRMQQAIDVACESGRRLAVTGRRMEQTVETCRRMKYLTVPEGVVVKLDDLGKYPAHELAVLTTGSQGEPMAALSQMARREYNRMKIQPGDTILYSARPIPGNEAAIWRIINQLFRLGANVVYQSETPIHVSGHAYREELKTMVNLTQPFYIAPVHGEPRHQALFRDMARAMGWPEHRVFTLENGDALEIGERSASLGEKVTAGERLIDQHGNVAVTDQVLGERAALGHDGAVIVSVGINMTRGHVVSRPSAQIRGFSGPPTVVDDVLHEVRRALGELSPAELTERGTVEATISDAGRRTISRLCQQRPIVVPVVVTSD